MKVLVSSLSRHFGGVESLFCSIVQTFQSEMQQMDFICTDSSAADEEAFLSAGAYVFHIPSPSSSLKKYVGRFNQIFRDGNYAIYHVNLTRFRFPLDVMIAKKHGVKVILHCHSTRIYDNGSRKTRIVRKIEQVLFRPVMLACSDRNIACSQNAGNYLFGKHRFEVLHNGIDLERFQFSEEGRNRIRKEFGLSDSKVVGHVGRFSIEKNHVFFLKIAKELLTIDNNYAFICTGEGELLEETKRLASEWGLIEKVVFTGRRSDIEDLLSAMDVFLFPSLHEALPMTLIEAQANGLDCVVSDCITKEIDVDGRITRLALSDSTEKWAKTVEKAVTRKRNELFRPSLFEGFDIKEMTGKLTAIYNSL